MVHFVTRHSEEFIAAKLAVEAILREAADASYWLGQLWLNVSHAHREHEQGPPEEKLRAAEKRYFEAAALLKDAEEHVRRVRR